MDDHPKREQLLAFVEGRLDDSMQQLLEEHIAKCDTCCEVLQGFDLRSMQGQVDAILQPELAGAGAKAARTADCPTNMQLEQFAAGTGASDHLSSVARHVADCQACRSTIVKLGCSEDTIVSRIHCAAEGSRFDGTNQRLGDYELLGKLRAGGMGEVYKARHTKLDRTVALKVLRPNRMNDDEVVSRFQREMIAVGKLDHPNIVRAYDARESEGIHYLVMELVEGVDLASLVDQAGPLSISDSCEIIRQAATGLQYAHDRDLIHRDLKPSNLILSADASVKIVDFGLARLVKHLGPKKLTESGQLMGTLDYMAPEQARTVDRVDHRADIYSLGCTLYELVTGHAPFDGPGQEAPIEKLIAHTQAPVEAVQVHRPDAPDKLNKTIRRMLAKEPDERYASAKEVAEDLAPLATDHDLTALLERVESGVPSRPASSQYGMEKTTTTRRSGRRRLAPFSERLALGVALLLLTVSAGVMYLPSLILFASDRGNLVVETEDPDVRLAFQNGQVSIHDQVSGRSYNLRIGRNPVRAGKYTIHVKAAPAGIEFSSRRFTLMRGRMKIVTVRLDPPGPYSPQSIDLLALIDPRRDSMDGLHYSGEWSKDGGILVSPIDPYTCLQIPFAPPEEYVLELSVKRIEGDRDLNLGILIAGTQCTVMIDTYPEHGHLTGLARGWLAHDQEEAYRGYVIPYDRIVDIVCEVTRRGVLLRCDGQVILDWQGHPNQLPQSARLPPEEAVLFLQTAESVFCISKMQLRPISGSGGHIEFAGVSVEPQLYNVQRFLWEQSHAVVLSGVDGSISRITTIRELPETFSLIGFDLRGSESFSHRKMGLISGVETLISLDFCNSELTSDHLSSLRDLPHLRRLDISLTRITDFGLAELKRFPNLRYLAVAGTDITDDGLRHLRSIPRLEHLDLRYTKVSGDGLRHLRTLGSLRRLELDHMAIDDSDAERISELAELEYLSLAGIAISDKSLKHFRDLTNLKRLSLLQTRVTSAGIEALQEAIPTCVIEPPANEARDLLSLVDATGHNLAGPEWQRDGDKLVSPVARPEATIAIPYAPPTEYIMGIQFVKKRAGDDSIGLDLGFVAAESRFNLFYHSDPTYAVYLHTSDEHASAISQATFRDFLDYELNRLTSISLTVRRNRITAARDGRLFINWNGDSAGLFADPDFRVNDARCPFIRVWGNQQFEIHRIELTPISGNGVYVDAEATDADN